MFKFEKTERVIMDKYLAKEWLLLNTRNPRKIRSRRVAELKTLMNQGLFLEGDIAFARLDYEDGKKVHVLTNGQHQITAFLDSALKNLPVRYMKHSCPAPTDLSLLWRQFDGHAPRSHGDCLKIEADSLGLTWQTETLRRLGSAMVILENKMNAFKETKVMLLHKYLKEGSFVDSIFIGSTDKKHLSKGPVVHAMILTWRKSHRDAQTFWFSVRDGEQMKKSHPAFQLREFLRSARLYRRNVNGDLGLRAGMPYNIVTDHEITSRCITAWNAFRKGRPTKIRYFIHKPIPEAI